MRQQLHASLEFSRLSFNGSCNNFLNMKISVNDPPTIINYYYLFIVIFYLLSIQISTKFYFTFKNYFKSQLDQLGRKDFDLFHNYVDIT